MTAAAALRTFKRMYFSEYYYFAGGEHIVYVIIIIMYFIPCLRLPVEVSYCLC